MLHIAVCPPSHIASFPLSACSCSSVVVLRAKKSDKRQKVEGELGMRLLLHSVTSHYMVLPFGNSSSWWVPEAYDMPGNISSKSGVQLEKSPRGKQKHVGRHFGRSAYSEQYSILKG